MRKLVVILLFCVAFSGFSQEKDTLFLDLEGAEKLLLENNLELLAEQLNLDMAQAAVIQAKVWPNPTLSISDFNPYISDYQKRHAEEQASLFSKSFGQYRQVEVQLEQLFYLSGKRRKQKQLAEVSAEKAGHYLENFLLELKTNFRNEVYDFYYDQVYARLLEEEIESLQRIVNSFQRQVAKENVAATEFMRLRATLLNLKEEHLDVKHKLSRKEGELRILLNVPYTTPLSFDFPFLDPSDQILLELEELQEQALKLHPEIHYRTSAKEQAKKELVYEKSLAVPDVELSANYDRGGGIYPDFWGVGIAMDLPFFNANKGNIRKAEIAVEQEAVNQQQHVQEIQNTVYATYQNLLETSHFLKEIDTDYIVDLDRGLQAYKTHFTQQNINAMEFVDFLETYIANKKSIMENQRNYLKALEDLKYATGSENLMLD